jgi:hypothetical protein
VLRLNALGTSDEIEFTGCNVCDRLHWVISISFWLIDTGCIESTVIDATWCDRSTSVLTIISVVADDQSVLVAIVGLA